MKESPVAFKKWASVTVMGPLMLLLLFQLLLEQILLWMRLLEPTLSEAEGRIVNRRMMNLYTRGSGDLITTSTEHADDTVTVEHHGVLIDELVEGSISITDLTCGEFVTESHEHGFEGVHVDLTGLFLKGTESLGYNLVIISLTSGLVGEHLEEGGEVDWAWGFSKHGIEGFFCAETSDLVVYTTDVFLAQDTIVITVHDSEAILELSYLSLGEHVEDIATRLLGLLGPLG